jgi:hypothetical protein
MRHMTYPSTCSVCGGEGVTDRRNAGKDWIVGHTMRHTNPQICADNLARKKRELDEREVALNTKSETA